MAKIPVCPKCKNKLSQISYYWPEEILHEKQYKEKKWFFGENFQEELELGLENMLKYHCFNCNNSYTEDFTRVVEQNYNEDRINNAKKYIEDFIEEVANKEINSMNEKEKKSFLGKPQYQHFGYGLYLRNKYIHGKKFDMRIDADGMSHQIFDRIVEKINIKKDQ